MNIGKLNKTVWNYAWPRLEKLTKRFISFHTRPMYAHGVIVKPFFHHVVGERNVAIIIQGPVVKDYDFTLESVKLYKKYFPMASIILSTWSDEEGLYLQRFRKEGIHIITTQKPSYTGPKNINLQIISTAAGIQLAQENGLLYALKTRTDQRFYNPAAIDFLINLTEIFPIRKGVQQHQRIIGFGFKGRYRNYFLSDSLMFGDIRDLACYWHTGCTFSKDPGNAFRWPETYLFQEFLRKCGHPIKNTHEDSIAVYADRCVMIDPSLIDWYWYKYNRFREYRYLYYQNADTILFSDWLGLYRQYEN